MGEDVDPDIDALIAGELEALSDFDPGDVSDSRWDDLDDVDDYLSKAQAGAKVEELVPEDVRNALVPGEAEPTKISAIDEYIVAQQERYDTLDSAVADFADQGKVEEGQKLVADVKEDSGGEPVVETLATFNLAELVSHREMMSEEDTLASGIREGERRKKAQDEARIQLLIARKKKEEEERLEMKRLEAARLAREKEERQAAAEEAERQREEAERRYIMEQKLSAMRENALMSGEEDEMRRLMEAEKLAEAEERERRMQEQRERERQEKIRLAREQEAARRMEVAAMNVADDEAYAIEEAERIAREKAAAERAAIEKAHREAEEKERLKREKERRLHEKELERRRRQIEEQAAREAERRRLEELERQRLAREEEERIREQARRASEEQEARRLERERAEQEKRLEAQRQRAAELERVRVLREEEERRKREAEAAAKKREEQAMAAAVRERTMAKVRVESVDFPPKSHLGTFLVQGKDSDKTTADDDVWLETAAVAFRQPCASLKTTPLEDPPSATEIARRRLDEKMSVFSVIESVSHARLDIEAPSAPAKGQGRPMPRFVQEGPPDNSDITDLKEYLEGLYGSVGRMEEVEVMDLDYKRLGDLSPLAACRALWRLNVGQTKLTSLASLKGPQSLRVLMASANKLPSLDLPPFMDLRTLQIFACGTSWVPDDLAQRFPALQVLDLNQNELHDAEFLRGMRNLVCLGLAGNAIDSLPSQLWSPLLATANFSHNKLMNVSDLGNFAPHLLYFQASGNLMRRLPSCADLVCLRSISLGNNKITSLKAFGCLPALYALFLESNRIKHVDTGLNLPSLRILDLSFNNLAAYDDVIRIASAVGGGLETLQLDSNPVERTPGFHESTVLAFPVLQELNYISIDRHQRDYIYLEAIANTVPPTSESEAKEWNSLVAAYSAQSSTLDEDLEEGYSDEEAAEAQTVPLTWTEMEEQVVPEAPPVLTSLASIPVVIMRAYKSGLLHSLLPKRKVVKIVNNRTAVDNRPVANERGVRVLPLLSMLRASARSRVELLAASAQQKRERRARILTQQHCQRLSMDQPRDDYEAAQRAAETTVAARETFLKGMERLSSASDPPEQSGVLSVHTSFVQGLRDEMTAVRRLKEEKEEQLTKREHSAVVLQRFARGFIMRRRYARAVKAMRQRPGGLSVTTGQAGGEDDLEDEDFEGLENGSWWLQDPENIFGDEDRIDFDIEKMTAEIDDALSEEQRQEEEEEEARTGATSLSATVESVQHNDSEMKTGSALYESAQDEQPEELEEEIGEQEAEAEEAGHSPKRPVRTVITPRKKRLDSDDSDQESPYAELPTVDDIAKDWGFGDDKRPARHILAYQRRLKNMELQKARKKKMQDPMVRLRRFRRSVAEHSETISEAGASVGRRRAHPGSFGKQVNANQYSGGSAVKLQTMSLAAGDQSRGSDESWDPNSAASSPGPSQPASVGADRLDGSSSRRYSQEADLRRSLGPQHIRRRRRRRSSSDDQHRGPPPELSLSADHSVGILEFATGAPNRRLMRGRNLVDSSSSGNVAARKSHAASMRQQVHMNSTVLGGGGDPLPPAAPSSRTRPVRVRSGGRKSKKQAWG